MPNPIGYSFAPTFENSQLARSSGAGAQPQEALQVLSYRLPRVTGANAISPLVSDEMRGGPNMSVLESVFRTILGPEAAAALLRGGGVMPTGSAPSPSVRPGVLDPGKIGPLTPLPGAQPDPYDRAGWEEYLANPPAQTERPQIPAGPMKPRPEGGLVPLPGYNGSGIGTTGRTQNPNPFAGGYHAF